jgi:hypothetical protein
MEFSWKFKSQAWKATMLDITPTTAIVETAPPKLTLKTFVSLFLGLTSNVKLLSPSYSLLLKAMVTM